MNVCTYVCMYVCMYVRIHMVVFRACVYLPFSPKPPLHAVFGRLSQVVRRPHVVAKACCLLSLTAPMWLGLGDLESRLDVMGRKSTSAYRSLSLFRRLRRRRASPARVSTSSFTHVALEGLTTVMTRRGIWRIFNLQGVATVFSMWASSNRISTRSWTESLASHPRKIPLKRRTATPPEVPFFTCLNRDLPLRPAKTRQFLHQLLSQPRQMAPQADALGLLPR